jgi:hypothetical protein
MVVLQRGRGGSVARDNLHEWSVPGRSSVPSGNGDRPGLVRGTPPAARRHHEGGGGGPWLSVVAVTGSARHPIGIGVEAFWDGLRSARSVVRTLTCFDPRPSESRQGSGR